MKLLKVAALFPLILSLAASSQVAVYGAFSAAKTSLGIGVETTNWLYGATGGVYFDHGHLGRFETGLDARIAGLYQPDSGDFIHDKFFGGYAGPRLSVRTRHLGLKPYGEALFGGVRSEGDAENDSKFPNPYAVSFAYQLVAGADVPVLPRIDWRVVEFSFTGIPNRHLGHENGISASIETITTGVVFRF